MNKNKISKGSQLQKLKSILKQPWLLLVIGVVAILGVVNIVLSASNRLVLDHYPEFRLSLNPLTAYCQVNSLRASWHESELEAHLYASQCNWLGQNNSQSAHDDGLQVKKPILYLYPEQTTEVEVRLQHPERITTQYPTYSSDGWRMTAQSNGNLQDAKGNNYYALYWEESEVKIVDFSQGFYVEKEQSAQFLENKLTEIGLNDRERNEFIMYWLPKLEKNSANLVHFVLTDELQEHNQLQITPTPDSLLRVHIYIKPAKVKTSPTLQKFDKFERRGFTAVEWGGVDYEK